MFWISLFIWIAVTVAVELIRPKPSFENARPKSLGDFRFPTATEGRVVPLIWGKVKMEGPNLIWYGNFRKYAKKQNVKTGIFSSEDVIVGYWYYVGMQFGLCHGPLTGPGDGLGRIWVNNKVVRTGAGLINKPTLFGGEDAGSGGIVGDVVFYPGSSTQAVNSYLTSYQSPQPAYRGTCYAVFEADGAPLTLDLFIGTVTYAQGSGYIGMSNNVAPWAFELTRIPDGLNMATEDPGAEAPNTYDANPANVLYEILTNTDWGLSISPSQINVTNFQSVASTLAAEGNGFSMVIDNATEVTKLITEVQRQIDGTLFYNRSDGQWEIQLARDDYDPDLLTVYDEGMIIELQEYTRRTWEETSNQVRVAFTDRDDNYKDTFALGQDGSNIDIQGQTIQSDVNYPGVKNRTLANALAWRDLRALSYPLSKIKFTINRSAWALAPGGVFKFSWDALGISEAVYRVVKINYGKFGDSKITVDAFQDIFGTDVGVFSDPDPSGWQDPNEPPAAPTAANTLVFEAPRQITVKDTYSQTLNPRVWMGARDPGGGTTTFRSYTRAGPSQPIGGSYSTDAPINAFQIVGTLDAALDEYGSTAARPNTSYNIDVDELDTLDGLLIDSGPSNVESLATIAWVGDDGTDGEWIGFEKCSDQGGGVFRLERIYRGLFNSAPKAHASGTRVWFMGAGGNLNRLKLSATQDEMDVQVRGVNGQGDETTEGATPEIEVSLVDLFLCPLAPRDPVVNSVYAPSSEDIDTDYSTETGLSGDDALGMEVEITPRDWTEDNVLLDETLRPTDWLAEDPEFDFTLILDPDGTPAETAIDQVTATETPTSYLLRNEVIIAVGANRSIPSTGRIKVVARHTLDAVDYTNPFDMLFDLSITSALQSADDITHGGVSDTASTAVIYGETGNYTVDIHTALPGSGTLEININSGGWVTLLGIGVTSNTVAITANDSVELRTQTAKPAANQYFDVTGPTAELGYGVLLP